jgi:hypothetical protein
LGGHRDKAGVKRLLVLSLKKTRPAGVLFFGRPWKPSVVISSVGKLCHGMFSVDNERNQMKSGLSLAVPLRMKIGRLRLGKFDLIPCSEIPQGFQEEKVSVLEADRSVSMSVIIYEFCENLNNNALFSIKLL